MWSKVMLSQTRGLLVNGGIATFLGSKWHFSSVLQLFSAHRDHPNRPTLTWCTRWGVKYEIRDRGGPLMGKAILRYVRTKFLLMARLGRLFRTPPMSAPGDVGRSLWALHRAETLK